MGNYLFTRENARIEEIDPSSSNAYRYPPIKGNYFASHYIMAGERFETSQPEAYLFGDNMDLNFLGGRPTPFPYPAPQPNEPTRTLRSLMNIRKESLRFVKVPEPLEREGSVENASLCTSYNIEFSFDTDVKCAITIYYFCTEEITPNAVIYTPKHMSMNSETYHYKKGVNQQFSQVSHVFDPSKYTEDMLTYRFEDEVIPVLIQCLAEEGEEPRQSHALIAAVEKNADGSYMLKPLKQKLFVDGLCYLIQEIYGIENKNAGQPKDVTDDDVGDSGSECVICMSDPRDSLILPCRHLCLCNNCAESLRYAANNCPICRAPFRALLQIKAVRKSTNPLVEVSHNSENQHAQDIPPGYEPVPLIEALNGPMQQQPVPIVPAFVPSRIPSFANSPDIRQKHRNLERHHSSSASLKHPSNTNAEKEETSSDKILDSALPEGIMGSIKSASKKAVLKSESLSLTRGEGRRHRKGCRTSSAPEKMRLLANSVPTVSEVGSAKRIMEKDAELAETKSLLESNTTADESPVVASPKTSRPCSRISLSTPHSLHLCERSSKDTSPGGDDSDYYTPEDPTTTIFVDQGTDTSLDAPQGIEMSRTGDSGRDHPVLGKHKVNRERHPVVDGTVIVEQDFLFDDETVKKSEPIKKREIGSVINCHSLVVNLGSPNSLPSTPASHSSNPSSGDSFGSASSSHVLLRPQSYGTLPE